MMIQVMMIEILKKKVKRECVIKKKSVELFLFYLYDVHTSCDFIILKLCVRNNFYTTFLKLLIS